MIQNSIERAVGFVIQLNEPLVSSIKNRIRQQVYSWCIDQRQVPLPGITPPVRVVFLVYYPSMWPSLQTVYEKMCQDENFEPVIVTLPTQSHGILDLTTNESNYDYFAHSNLNVRKGYDPDSGGWLDLQELKPDLVFVLTPYDAYPMYKSRKIRRYSRLCYVPYGIMAAKIQDNQFNKPFHYRCWKIFCETALHKQLFGKYSKVNENKLIVTGYPKLDAYRQVQGNDASQLWNLPPNSPMKRVIWAPHWSIPLQGSKRHWLNFSTFHLNHRFFLEKMKHTTKSIQWLFKPHPDLSGRVVRAGLMSGKEYDEYLEEMLSLPNVIHCQDSAYLDYFVTSDALLTCSVSFLSEYLPTRNPILLLENGENIGFNEYGEKLVEHFYKARTLSEIDEFLSKTVLGGDDWLRNRRMKTLDEIMYFPDYHIGEYIVNYLKQELLGEGGN